MVNTETFIATATRSHIGGGTDSGTWWTGGQNHAGANKTKAKTNLGLRPTDFCSAENVKTACRTRLPEQRRLEISKEKEQLITVSSWACEIKKKAKECGMDTVFYVYDPTAATKECSLFDNWVLSLQNTSVIGLKIYVRQE